MSGVNDYEDREAMQRMFARHEHRELVGGMWDEIGRLQLDFMEEQGLLPSMRLLDVGCGCLRGGVHFVRFLDPENYFGIDALQELLDAGYEIELKTLGLVDKLPRTHLVCDSEFRFERFGVSFDMAIAQSLFTHLPLNHIRLCLARLATVMKPGGQFFATVFICGESEEWAAPIVHEPGQVTTYPAMDPYHVRVADLRWCADGLPWAVSYVGDWHHPRAQKMVRFERTPD